MVALFEEVSLKRGKYRPRPRRLTEAIYLIGHERSASVPRW
jgi:hypothetical protein